MVVTELQTRVNHANLSVLLFLDQKCCWCYIFLLFSTMGGGMRCAESFETELSPKKVVGKVTQHCNGEMRNWLGKCSILLGKCSNLLGKRCNLLGKWSKFVGEMKQMDGEMKQNVLGRCPEGKVKCTLHCIAWYCIVLHGVVQFGVISLYLSGISPTHFASFPHPFASFPQQICFISPTNCFVSPTNCCISPTNCCIPPTSFSFPQCNVVSLCFAQN